MQELTKLHGACRLYHGGDVSALSSASEYRLLYCVRGGGELICEGESYPIESGSLYLLAAERAASATLVDPSKSECYTVCFDTSMLTEEGRQLLPRLVDPLYHTRGLSPSVIRLIEKFDEAMSMPRREAALFMKLHLTELLARLSYFSPREAGEDGSLGARVKQYVDSHLTASLSLDELARHFFVSKFYLCRSFKSHTGMSVQSYVRAERIALADALIQGGETASSAAYRVGFGDYSSFFRTYKKLKGCAPTECNAHD